MCSWIMNNIYQNAHQEANSSTAYLQYIPVVLRDTFEDNWIPINMDGTPIQ